MSIITEQVEDLRKLAKDYSESGFGFYRTDRILRKAADTIESLSKKLQSANIEQCAGNLINKTKLLDDLRLLINRNSFGETTAQTEMSIGEVASLIQSQKIYGGGWISCKDKLPEEKINPITQNFYEYQVTFQSGNIKDIRHYKFGRGHWWNGSGIMDEYVTAWRQNLEPYHEP